MNEFPEEEEEDNADVPLREVPFDVHSYVEEFLNRDALVRLFAYFRVRDDDVI